MTAESTELSRRTLVKGAAWSLPVIAAVAATPMAAASTVTNVGDFQVDGSCGVLGLLGPGFTITAGAEALPAGTVITISTSGIANIGLFSITGGLADIQLIGSTGNRVELTAPLAAGATADLRAVVSLGVGSTMTAVLTLPAGYTAGTGAKSSGGVEQTLVLCSAS
ncbi:hypothetical protein JF531_06355 [Microbacterium esteraromaticum]|uniref:hypothetical protein n=1 Tax=Microbacterium esteraromaticum TaxID=57043 RepID=UPI001A90A2FF|nr:hypothetical protein [Microbacterium esteraromaticum]MBN8424142.1 hypothetical protein [Microbacterium esteraromaticum]